MKKNGTVYVKNRDEKIKIEIIRKKVKNINLSISKNKGIRVSAPLKVKNEIIENFIKSKWEWIKKYQNKFENQKVKPILKYITGENHFYKGKKYLLNLIITEGKQKVEINDKHINLYVKKDIAFAKKEKLMDEWYRSELKRELKNLIEKWEKIINITVNEYRTKKMKTKWGTCNPRAKRIWLNLELSKKPVRCLEYVVVHEIVHFLEPSHNHRFKSFLDQYLKNWRELKKELNEF